MPTLLIRKARLIVTMDADRREMANGAVFVRDRDVEAVAATAEWPAAADELIDATDQIGVPGLVNTHPTHTTTCSEA